MSWGPLLADSVEGAEQMVSAYALSAALSLLSFSLGAALTWPLLGHAPQAGDALAAYKLGLAASVPLFALCARSGREREAEPENLAHRAEAGGASRSDGVRRGARHYGTQATGSRGGTALRHLS